MWQNIPVIKRLWPSLRKLWLRTFFSGRFVLRRYYGAQFLCDYQAWVERRIIAFGDFERAQLNYFLPLNSQIKADIFLDIGANFGLYSLIMANSGVQKIYAYEPSPHNLAALWSNIRLNDAFNKIEVIPKAVSDKSGKIIFSQKEKEFNAESKVDSNGNLEIDAVALDQTISFSGQRISIKMDVEGHELQALNGMKNLLKNNQCFLQVECWFGHAAPVSQFMTSLGYWQVQVIEEDYYWTNFQI